MADVHHGAEWGGKRRSVDGGGPPRDDGQMDTRLTKLETQVTALATKADVEGVRSDLHKMDAAIVRWMIATVLALFLGFAGLFFTMQNSINGALERAAKPAAVERQEPAAPQPIIIQIPSQPDPEAKPPAVAKQPLKQ